MSVQNITTKNQQSDRLFSIVAVLWGFAEATVFFIIPDVLISYRALRSFRAGLRACGFALLGALIGGTLMYAFASHAPGPALSVVNHVPTVTKPVIAEVNHEYQVHGVVAVIYGPLRTAPYKLYAVLAPVFNIGYPTFIAISIIARLARFALVTALTTAISCGLQSRISKKGRIAILSTVWLAVYALYFATHWI